MGGGHKGYFLLQQGDGSAVFFEVDLIASDIANDAFVLRLVHQADTDLDARCLRLGEELWFDRVPRLFIHHFH